MVHLEEISEGSTAAHTKCKKAHAQQEEYDNLMSRVKVIPTSKLNHEDLLDEQNFIVNNKVHLVSSIIMTIFMACILGFMEYVVCQRNHNLQLPSWSVDFNNAIFISWLQNTMTNTFAIFPIVFFSFKWKDNRFFDIGMMIASIAVSSSMIYIVRFNPIIKYYSYMPGLAAVWILLAAQMQQATSFLSLCCTLIVYYVSQFQL